MNIKEYYKKKSLQLKGIIILCLIGILYAPLYYGIQYYLIRDSFEKLEISEAILDSNRVKHAIELEIINLNKLNYDWASWDDTYRFVFDKNKEYIKSNFNLSTFVNSTVNLVYVLDLKGNVIWGKIIDFKTKKEISLKEFPAKKFNLKSHLIFDNKRNNLKSDSSRSGIIYTDNGLLLISSRPIFPSNGKGLSRGIMIMGRFITEEMINEKRRLTDVNFNIIPVKRKIMRDELIQLSYKLTKQNPFYTVFHDNYITVYSIFPGLTVKKLFLIETLIKTKIIERGGETVFNILFFTFSVMLVTFFSIMYMLQISIFKPVIQLSKTIRQIGKDRSFNIRVQLDRDDEIGILAFNFNSMLDQLEGKNKKLEKLAVTDGLTGLFNKRHLLQVLEREITVAKRYNHHLSVVMIDIDFFKKVNDTYGHQAGDHVLVKISNTIANTLRATDMVGRYGGEEFIVILPNEKEEGAINAAERIRHNVENLEWVEAGMHITISCGVCSDIYSSTNIIECADRNLYAAKENGRNRVVSE